MEWVGGLSLRLPSVLFLLSCIQTKLSALYTRRGKVCALQPTCDFTIYHIPWSNLFLTATIPVCFNLLGVCFMTFWWLSHLFCVPKSFLNKCLVFQILPFPLFLPRVPTWPLGRCICHSGVWGGAWRCGREALRSAWKSQICFLVACWALLLCDSCPWGHCFTCWPYC